MNCPNCNSSNIEHARFCAKCGTLLPTEAVPDEKDPLIGQTLGGRYVIKRMLGEGGMGRVYEAEKNLAGSIQPIAIKTLHPHLSSDPAVLARFNRECSTMVKLTHPSTIRVEDFGAAPDGTLYIAMEFVKGTNAMKEIETNGPMAPDRIEGIMRQVCGSLGEAHKAGIIHRDLKPENIVLMNVGDDRDVVKVLDFGIAARKDSVDAKKEQKLTQQGMVLGTPPYMSPEQFMGKELTAQSDIYSLGVMTYEMLTGKLPFDASTPWEWATQHMTAQPFPFENFADVPTVTDIPGKMKTAIFRALKKDPKERQESVKQFFEELQSGKVIETAPRESALPKGPETATMAPYESPKGATQAGIPAPSLGDVAPIVPAGPALPPPPVAVKPTGQPNKGLIFALMGLVGIGVIVSIGLIIKRSSNKGDNGTLQVPEGSSGGTASVAPLPPSTLSAPPVVTTTAPPTTVVAKPPPALTGDEACKDATKRANSGDVNGATNSYRNCSGPGKENARRAIAAAIPGATQSAAFRGDCKGARSIASQAGQYGAASINVDQKYSQCKGK